MFSLPPSALPTHLVLPLGHSYPVLQNPVSLHLQSLSGMLSSVSSPLRKTNFFPCQILSKGGTLSPIIPDQMLVLHHPAEKFILSILSTGLHPCALPALRAPSLSWRTTHLAPSLPFHFKPWNHLSESWFLSHWPCSLQHTSGHTCQAELLGIPKQDKVSLGSMPLHTLWSHLLQEAFRFCFPTVYI